MAKNQTRTCTNFNLDLASNKRSAILSNSYNLFCSIGSKQMAMICGAEYGKQKKATPCLRRPINKPLLNCCRNSVTGMSELRIWTREFPTSSNRARIQLQGEIRLGRSYQRQHEESISRMANVSQGLLESGWERAQGKTWILKRSNLIIVFSPLISTWRGVAEFYGTVHKCNMIKPL